MSELITNFYSPLIVEYYPPYNGSPTNDILTDVLNAVDYYNNIEKALLNNRERFFLDKRFLNTFVGSSEISDITNNMFAFVEIHSNELWGVTTVEHTEPYTEEQIRILKDYIAVNYSERWGERFYTHPIKTRNTGNIYVNFASDDINFEIMTENEFKQKINPEETIIHNPILEVCISGEIFELPMSEYDLIENMHKQKIDTPESEYSIEFDDYFNLYGTYDYINLNCSNLHELNFLADQIASMDDQTDFYAYTQYAEKSSVKQLINATLNMDKIMLHPFDNDKELGNAVLENGMDEELNHLPNKIYDLLDKQEVGKRWRESEDGKFVKDGYIVVNGFEDFYDGIALPKDDVPMFKICVGSSSVRKWIDIPAQEKQICTDLKVNDISELKVYDFKTTIPQIKEKCQVDISDLELLNNLANCIQAMDSYNIRKYKAILETDTISNISDACYCQQIMNSYDFDMHLTHPNDYVKMMVCEKLGFNGDEEVLGKLNDLDTAFGEELMKKNGMIPTQYGAVTPPKEVAESFSEKEMNQDSSGIGMGGIT